MHIFIISNRAVLRSINFAMEELITYVTYIKYSSVQLAIPAIINQQNCYFKNAKKKMLEIRKTQNRTVKRRCHRLDFGIVVRQRELQKCVSENIESNVHDVHVGKSMGIRSCRMPHSHGATLLGNDHSPFEIFRRAIQIYAFPREKESQVFRLSRNTHSVL